MHWCGWRIDPTCEPWCWIVTGRSFSAGADLGWMHRMAGFAEAENLADAAALARMLHRLDRLPMPTLAVIQGSAYGGGVGLVACCDIAIASEQAGFCLTEVKLGLIPATIGPYVVNAIGARQARRYFTTAEDIPAARAREIGLVHEGRARTPISRPRRDRVIAALLQGAPGRAGRRQGPGVPMRGSPRWMPRWGTRRAASSRPAGRRPRDARASMRSSTSALRLGGPCRVRAERTRCSAPS